MIKPIAIPPPSVPPRPGPSTPSLREAFLATQTHCVNLAEALAHELGHDPTRLPAAQATFTQNRALRSILASPSGHLADLQAILRLLTKLRAQDRRAQLLALKTRRVALMEKKFAASPGYIGPIGGPDALTDEVLDEVERRLAAL